MVRPVNISSLPDFFFCRMSFLVSTEFYVDIITVDEAFDKPMDSESMVSKEGKSVSRIIRHYRDNKSLPVLWEKGSGIINMPLCSWLVLSSHNPSLEAHDKQSGLTTGSFSKDRFRLRRRKLDFCSWVHFASPGVAAKGGWLMFIGWFILSTWLFRASSVVGGYGEYSRTIQTVRKSGTILRVLCVCFFLRSLCYYTSNHVPF